MSLRAIFVLCIILPCCFGWADRIRDGRVCEPFHVTHSRGMIITKGINFDITLAMVKDGYKTSTDCIEADTTYEIQFKSLMTDSNMRGILFKDISERLKGIKKEPTTIPSDALPRYIKTGICGPNSISHSCPFKSGCSIGDGQTLNITFQSVSSRHLFPPQFRFALVMDGSHYIANSSISYPLCSSTETEPPPEDSSEITASPVPTTKPDCDDFEPGLKDQNPVVSNSADLPAKNYSATEDNFSSFIVTSTAKPLSKTCGKTVDDVKPRVIYTSKSSNLTYRCVANQTVKVTTCYSGCNTTVSTTVVKDGKETVEEKELTMYCRAGIDRMRPRHFNCTAFTYIHNNLLLGDYEAPPPHTCSGRVRQTKKCECFLSSDIVKFT